MRFTVLTLLLVCAGAAQAGEAMTRQIDAQQSQASFTVHTRLLTRITGQFSAVEGEVKVADDGSAQVNAWIDLAELRMANPQYKAELESPTFFDSARYPRIHFHSAALPRSLVDTGGDIEGDLTLHGQTRNMHFTLKPGSCVQDPHSGCTLRLLGTLQRSDFGMSARSLLLSDYVQLNLRIMLEPISEP